MFRRSTGGIFEKKSVQPVNQKIYEAINGTISTISTLTFWTKRKLFLSQTFFPL